MVGVNRLGINYDGKSIVHCCTSTNNMTNQDNQLANFPLGCDALYVSTILRVDIYHAYTR